MLLNYYTIYFISISRKLKMLGFDKYRNQASFYEHMQVNYKSLFAISFLNSSCLFFEYLNTEQDSKTF